DPYEAIRRAYPDGTDTESEPFEDPIDTETPESPLAIAPPIPLSESTLPVLVPILRRTARMAVRVPRTMSPGLSAGMAKVAAMSESTFRKRFRSFYESSPSVSPPDLPSRKRYRGTSELVEDSEEDDNEEDEEIEDSMDSDSVSRDREDEGPTAEDEDPAAKDEGVTTGVEGPGVDDEGYGLDSTHLPHGQTRRTGGLISDHAVRLEELSPALFKRYDRDIGKLFTRSMAVREEIFSQRYRFRSLGYEQERVAVTFGAIWRPMLALEAWAENRDLRLQLAEERRARLELAEVVDGIRRGQEPRGVFERFWNGLPRMGKAEMVDQARFAWGFLSVFGNANSNRVAITSRTGSYPDTRLRQ
ncbi:hypothetical protein Tco_1349488, partial [Tanacetum coccineum]